ncbi:unnamed protein product [Adineta steineri]|uniref:G-protein coupled receptors family 1 profile domain-containing protein n=1 Tax=Adineta steineri TaxID=433720 RepID=A0A815C2X8_9BILA|nr:unnamed protein product [Adineta steineri]CAF3541025.1 unnamed protein product [Adineta steineri]
MINNTTSSASIYGYMNCSITNGIIRYFGTFIFLIGIFSTILSICVFARKPLRRKSCCFYFLILAISDSIHLLTMTIEHLPYSFNIDLIIIHTSLCKITIFLIYFSNHLSNIVLTLASVDRFILIYCPSRSKHYCNVNRAKRFVLIAVIILFIANGHILFGYEKIQLDDKPLNVSYDCNIRRENIFYNKFFHFYDSYIESIFFIIIPFIIMFICSILIIFQIFETRKNLRYNTTGKFYYYTFYTSETIRQTVRKTFQEQGTTKLRDKDIQLCFMLIGTTLAFLIFCLPTEINDILIYTDREHSCSTWFRKVLLMLMQQIYYAGHFYIYTLTGQVFRKHLYAIFANKQNQSISSRFFSKFHRLKNQSTIRDQNEKSKSSFRTTSFINIKTHRPTTKKVLTNDLNDPSQKLLSNSKYIIGSY